MDIQVFAAHDELDDTVEILGIDGDDLVHLAHIERDAAVDGERIAFDRRPRPEWHDRDIGRRTQLYQRDDIAGRVSKDDGVGQHAREMGHEIARAWCRDRVCEYVWRSMEAES